MAWRTIKQENKGIQRLISKVYVQSGAKVNTFSTAVLGNETRVKTRKRSFQLPTLGNSEFLQIGLQSFLKLQDIISTFENRHSLANLWRPAYPRFGNLRLQNFNTFVPAFRNRKFLKLGTYSSKLGKPWFELGTWGCKIGKHWLEHLGTAGS